jgi:two-component system OmpR family sensor kinase
MIRWFRGVIDRIPLRVALVVSLLLLVTMALGVSGTAGTFVVRRYLVARVDTQLNQTALYIIENGLRDPKDLGNIALVWSSLYVAIVDNSGAGNGAVLTPKGQNKEPPKLPALNKAEAQRANGKFFEIRPVSGRGASWRAVEVRLPDDSGSLVVAIGLDEVNETVGNLAAAHLLIGAAVLAVLAIVGYAMIRTSMRRLTQVERTAQLIAAGDLTQRAPPAHPDTEVGRLSAAFNAMLTEIELAFRARERSELAARASEARMRRFAADASHELRTPLTSIRGFAELYRQGGADADHVIGRIEQHATRMSLLVDDLLLLARLDQQRPLERRTVDLLTIAADAVQDATATTDDHPVALRALADQPPVVLGDEVRLRQVVGNLVSNALIHTPPGTAVTVTVDVRDGMAVLEVADTGPGLAAEDAALVFERFFRTDPARTRVAGGTGLGLSIVKALVEAHGGEIVLDTAPGQGARFEVRLPLFTIDLEAPTPAPAALGHGTITQPAGS